MPGANKDLVSDIPEEKLDLAFKEIIRLCGEVIDAIRPNDQVSTVILVGGGSILIPEDVKFDGIDRIIKPK